MATDWVEMAHDVTGGRGHVPNKPNVIAARREKGWRLTSEPLSSTPDVLAETDDGNNKSTRKARSRAADIEE